MPLPTTPNGPFVMPFESRSTGPSEAGPYLERIVEVAMAHVGDTPMDAFAKRYPQYGIVLAPDPRGDAPTGFVDYTMVVPYRGADAAIEVLNLLFHLIWDLGVEGAWAIHGLSDEMAMSDDYRRFAGWWSATAKTTALRHRAWANAGLLLRPNRHLRRTGTPSDLPQSEGMETTGEEPGVLVWSRDGIHLGRMTGDARLCPMDGCSGVEAAVHWGPGLGGLEWICTKRMVEGVDGSSQIR